MYVYICTYVYMRRCTYVYMCICTYVYMRRCTYVYLYMYIDIQVGSWVSCNFCFCFVVTSFFARLYLLPFSLSHYAAVPSCLAAHWTTRMDLLSQPLLTTIQEPAGKSLELFIQYTLLSKDKFPVPPFNVFRILRELGEVFGLLLGKLAGLLYYVTFKSGWTGRSVGYETLCSRKVGLSCSGLEWCASTEAVQHSLQSCKTLSPKGTFLLQDPKP